MLSITHPIVHPNETRIAFLRISRKEYPQSLAEAVGAVNANQFTRQRCKIQGYLYLGPTTFAKLANSLQQHRLLWKGYGGTASDAPEEIDAGSEEWLKYSYRNVIYVIQKDSGALFAIDPSKGDTIRWIGVP